MTPGTSTARGSRTGNGVAASLVLSALVAATLPVLAWAGTGVATGGQLPVSHVAGVGDCTYCGWGRRGRQPNALDLGQWPVHRVPVRRLYLVVGDTNGVGDVFVRNLRSGATNVSRSEQRVPGQPAQRRGVGHLRRRPVRGVLLRATNLVARDTNRTGDVFLRDRSAGTTTRVSVRSDEKQSNGASQDLAISRHGGFRGVHVRGHQPGGAGHRRFPDAFARNSFLGPLAG